MNEEEQQKLKQSAELMTKLFNDLIVVMQAAWIEWKHGRGAESAMQWIENTLDGPGNIPDEDAPWSKDAQLWFNANKSDPAPICFCGNPSSIEWMHQGFCCEEHYLEGKAERERQDAVITALDGEPPQT